MKTIEPSAKVLNHRGFTPFTFIEFVGRTCYKSTDKITDTSADKFVHSLYNRRHFAMLEHWLCHFHLTCDCKTFHSAFHELGSQLRYSCAEQDLTTFFKVSVIGDQCFVSVSLRTLIELDELIRINHLTGVSSVICGILSSASHLFPTLFSVSYPAATKYNAVEYMEEEEFISRLIYHLSFIPGDYDIKHEVMKHIPHTVLFTCDRGVSHELVRHRPASFAQESTRYCNYSQEKFGREITVINPVFWDGPNPPVLTEEQWSVRYGVWRDACEYAEKAYFKLIDDGATPQEARNVLPNSLKTEVIVTATEDEWQHIIDLRYLALTGAPHPQMKQVMSMCVKDLCDASEGRLLCE